MKYTKSGLETRYYPDDKWLNDLKNHQRVKIVRAKRGEDKVYSKDKLVELEELGENEDKNKNKSANKGVHLVKRDTGASSPNNDDFEEDDSEEHDSADSDSSPKITLSLRKTTQLLREHETTSDHQSCCEQVALTRTFLYLN